MSTFAVYLLQLRTVCVAGVLLLVSLAAPSAVTRRAQFNDSALGSFPRFGEPPSLFELNKREIFEMLEWGCLYGTNQPHHSENKWADMDYNRSEAMADWQFMRGNTIWINEHMAVGHMMYDVFMIQVMQSVPIQRIVLQRAPCMNADLCLGTGSWGSFYEGFYTAMIDAFQPGVPIYLRWTWQDKDAKPIYLDGFHPTGYRVGQPIVPPQPEKVVLNSCKCFERVFRRRCMQCFHGGLSLSVVHKFKHAAYNLVNRKLKWERDAHRSIEAVSSPRGPLSKPRELTSHFDPNEPLVVTLSYRSAPASRHIRNVQTLIDILGSSLDVGRSSTIAPIEDGISSSPNSTTVTTSKRPSVVFRTHLSTNISMTYQDQISLVARSHVVISEHGAFQSNIVYMRRGSLFIELRGNYGHGEFVNFEKIANMFEVHYSHVVTKALTSHKDPAFDISVEECGEVLDLVREYQRQEPWRSNLMRSG